MSDKPQRRDTWVIAQNLVAATRSVSTLFECGFSDDGEDEICNTEDYKRLLQYVSECLHPSQIENLVEVSRALMERCEKLPKDQDWPMENDTIPTDRQEWTEEWPTEPGWYWRCQFIENYDGEIVSCFSPVLVFTDGDNVYYDDLDRPIHKGASDSVFWGKASIPDLPDPPEFDRDMFHDYVVEHGYGAPTEEAYHWAKVQIQCRGRSYSDVAHDVVSTGGRVEGWLKETEEE